MSREGGPRRPHESDDVEQLARERREGELRPELPPSAAVLVAATLESDARALDGPLARLEQAYSQHPDVLQLLDHLQRRVDFFCFNGDALRAYPQLLLRATNDLPLEPADQSGLEQLHRAFVQETVPLLRQLQARIAEITAADTGEHLTPDDRAVRTRAANGLLTELSTAVYQTGSGTDTRNQTVTTLFGVAATWAMAHPDGPQLNPEKPPTPIRVAVLHPLDPAFASVWQDRRDAAKAVSGERRRLSELVASRSEVVLHALEMALEDVEADSAQAAELAQAYSILLDWVDDYSERLRSCQTDDDFVYYLHNLHFASGSEPEMFGFLNACETVKQHNPHLFARLLGVDPLADPTRQNGRSDMDGNVFLLALHRSLQLTSADIDGGYTDFHQFIDQLRQFDVDQAPLAYTSPAELAQIEANMQRFAKAQATDSTGVALTLGSALSFIQKLHRGANERSLNIQASLERLALNEYTDTVRRFRELATAAPDTWIGFLRTVPERALQLPEVAQAIRERMQIDQAAQLPTDLETRCIEMSIDNWFCARLPDIEPAEALGVLRQSTWRDRLSQNDRLLELRLRLWATTNPNKLVSKEFESDVHDVGQRVKTIHQTSKSVTAAEYQQYDQLMATFCRSLSRYTESVPRMANDRLPAKDLDLLRRGLTMNTVLRWGNRGLTEWHLDAGVQDRTNAEWNALARRPRITQEQVDKKSTLPYALRRTDAWLLQEPAYAAVIEERLLPPDGQHSRLRNRQLYEGFFRYGQSDLQIFEELLYPDELQHHREWVAGYIRDGLNTKKGLTGLREGNVISSESQIILRMLGRVLQPPYDEALLSELGEMAQLAGDELGGSWDYSGIYYSSMLESFIRNQQTFHSIFDSALPEVQQHILNSALKRVAPVYDLASGWVETGNLDELQWKMDVLNQAYEVMPDNQDLVTLLTQINQSMISAAREYGIAIPDDIVLANGSLDEKVIRAKKMFVSSRQKNPTAEPVYQIPLFGVVRVKTGAGNMATETTTSTLALAQLTINTPFSNNRFALMPKYILVNNKIAPVYADESLNDSRFTPK